MYEKCRFLKSKSILERLEAILAIKAVDRSNNSRTHVHVFIDISKDILCEFSFASFARVTSTQGNRGNALVEMHERHVGLHEIENRFNCCRDIRSVDVIGDSWL